MEMVILILPVVCLLLPLEASCCKGEEEGNLNEVTVDVECLEGSIAVTIARGPDFPENFEFDRSNQADITCYDTSTDAELIHNELGLKEDKRIVWTKVPSSSDPYCEISICYELDKGSTSPTYKFPEPWICNYSAQCAVLENPAHGSVTLSKSANVFSVATYTCDDGYMVFGMNNNTCQTNGNWSGSEPSCDPMNTSLQVVLSTDSGSCVMVGTVVNFTCAINGTPPLLIYLGDETGNILDDTMCTETEELNPIKHFSVQVFEQGPKQYTCVVTNSSSYREQSLPVNISGFVTSYVQICFQLPHAYTCNQTIEALYPNLLHNITNKIGIDLSCHEPQSMSYDPPCDMLCPERLFYSAAVLMVNETDLNLSHLFDVQKPFIIDGIELKHNYGCNPTIASVPFPIPTCPKVESASTARAMTDTTVLSPTSTSSQSSDGDSHILIIVLVLVILLVTALVILAMAFVVAVCFMNRKKSDDDFASDIPERHLPKTGTWEGSSKPLSLDSKTIREGMNI